MDKLPDGWSIQAQGRDADGRCRVLITSPEGRSAAFVTPAELVTGMVLEQLAEAQDHPLGRPEP